MAFSLIFCAFKGFDANNEITVISREDGSGTRGAFIKSERIILSVKDSGIGIAPEHQARVFERFYRVDKSRFKETGGKGLGLSIIWNAAQLHHADVEIESTPNLGKTIRVLFPNTLLISKQ